MVDTEESEKLALAAAKGKILLTLRSGTDADLVTTRGIVPPQLFAATDASPPPPKAAPSRAAPVRQVKPAPAAVIPPPEEKKVVEILRGDLFESRDFAKRDRKGNP
jgi:Flp pilus assembly protein CpaB